MSEPVLAIPVPGNSKTAENLKTAFAVEARSNDRYHYFAEVAEKAKDSQALAAFKSVAEDKHKFAQGHLREHIKGGLGDPDTGKPSMDIYQVLDTATVVELEKSFKMYSQMADDARNENLPHLEEWFKSLATQSDRHRQVFEDLISTYRDPRPQ
jgi:rubrerythrin